MTQPPIRVVGVAGAGQMGSGIAQVVAMAGYRTLLFDVSAAQLARAREGVAASLAKLVEKGKATAEGREQALARLDGVTDLAALHGADLVIEAAPEDLELKTGLWRALDPHCPHHTLFASNTSSLPIARMAAVTGRPDRVLGLHFFNPVPLMPLVEVVRTVATGEAAFARALAFARSLGKEVVAARDTPGFVVNRLLVPYLLDAVRAREAGLASTADLDAGMKLGAGHPMGPLALLDLIGLDTVVQVAEAMFTEFREPRFAPPPLLTRLVALGHLGRKSGRGFYDYAGAAPVPAELGL